MSTNDGGPAFPHDWPEHTGMSLRDYFAGQALSGLYACPDLRVSDERLAEASYRIADLMLKERSKP